MRSAESVDLLIRHGSDVNAQNRKRSTPLHLAASSRLDLDGTIVRLLLRHGANVGAKDGEGRTPLEIALVEGNSWIAKLLLEHNARRW
jgi:ankyrin repeat protein